VGRVGLDEGHRRGNRRQHYKEKKGEMEEKPRQQQERSAGRHAGIDACVCWPAVVESGEGRLQGGGGRLELLARKAVGPKRWPRRLLGCSLFVCVGGDGLNGCVCVCRRGAFGH